MIELIRIDYRLIHGQVVVGWLNTLSIDRIVVIDNKAGSSESEKAILSLAKPQGKKLHIFTLEEALARKQKLSKIQERTALIFGDISTCYDFLKEFEGSLKEINYGAIPKKESAASFDQAVFLTDEDIEISKKLIALGYKIYSQQTPNATSKNLTNIL